MRYFFIAYFFSHLLVFNLDQSFQDRNPASYPNFIGTSASLTPPTPVVAPEPRKLGPPLNPNAITSMKDIEDSYGEGFLPQEIAMKKEVDASYNRLSQLMALRRSVGNNYNAANSDSEIRKAIRAEQERLSYWQRQRVANSQFAYHDIQLKYAATQIGLKPESHRRVDELQRYILHVFFEASSASIDTTFSSFSSPYSTSLVTLPEQFPGTVNRNADISEEFFESEEPQDSEDFIGPRPEDKPITTAI